MTDNEVSVKIVADASGVAPGVDIAKGSIEGLAPLLQSLNSQFAGLAEEIRASMMSGTTGTTEMAEGLRVLQAETEREAVSLREMVVGIHEGVESFNGLKSSIIEIGEVWATAFAVERIVDMAKEMGEAAEKVKHLSDEFGLSTAQVQSLQGVALGTGVSIDTLTRGMAILDKNTETAGKSGTSLSKALAIVGLSADDGRTQMQRLTEVADKFNELPAGPERMALAMELFGKSGRAMIPLLEKGSEGIAELTEKSKEYGIVSDDAQEKGMQLAEAVNESRMAWEGLKTTLESALAPALTEMTQGFSNLVKEMVQSYNSGGAVKQAFDAVKIAGAAVLTVLDQLAPVFTALADHLKLITSLLIGVGSAMAFDFVASATKAMVATLTFTAAVEGQPTSWRSLSQSWVAPLVRSSRLRRQRLPQWR